jgi:hypothetical protein
MIRNTFYGGPVAVLPIVLAVVLVAAVAASQPAQAASSGECVTARVDAPFRLPDGLLYPAGALTICEGGAYSPVDNFQRILVGGSAIGLFVSQRRSAEMRPMDLPQFLFKRGADGSLKLIGYTVPSTGRSVAYRLKSQDESLLARSRPRSDGSAIAPVAAIVATAGTR